MSIQLDDANEIERNYAGGPCNHVWDKEYYKGSNTGDYRCRRCGAAISEEELKKIRRDECAQRD